MRSAAAETGVRSRHLVRVVHPDVQHARAHGDTRAVVRRAASMPLRARPHHRHLLSTKRSSRVPRVWPRRRGSRQGRPTGARTLRMPTPPSCMVADSNARRQRLPRRMPSELGWHEPECAAPRSRSVPQEIWQTRRRNSADRWLRTREDRREIDRACGRTDGIRTGTARAPRSPPQPPWR